jgi:uncharacterized membrane protein YgdD (TMEM256/DUF423 family)
MTRDTGQKFLVAGSLLAALGVALGAYGAHGLSGMLESLGHQESMVQRQAWFETAVRYQMFHALGLLVVGVWARVTPNPWLRRAGFCFLAGVLLFCGCLIVMTFASPAWRKLGAIVPVGGLSLIAGWLAVMMAAVTHTVECEVQKT